MKNKNKIVLILAILSLLAFIAGSAYTYAKYLTKTVGTMGSKIKKWDIIVNNETISGKKVLDNNIVATFPNLNGHTKENKIAPGVEGQFTITIDYSHVDLDFTYDLSIANNDTIPDITVNNIKVDGVLASGDQLVVDASGITHVVGDITIDPTDTNKTTEITVYVKWYDGADNEMDNAEDTVLGIAAEDVDFDVHMVFTQQAN